MTLLLQSSILERHVQSICAALRESSADDLGKTGRREYLKQSSFTPVNGCRIIVGAAPFFFSWTLIAFLDGDVLTYELLESLKRLCLFNMMRASAALYAASFWMILSFLPPNVSRLQLDTN